MRVGGGGIYRTVRYSNSYYFKEAFNTIMRRKAALAENNQGTDKNLSNNKAVDSPFDKNGLGKLYEPHFKKYGANINADGTASLTESQRKMLREKYNMNNMSKNEYYSFLAELTNLNVISARDFNESSSVVAIPISDKEIICIPDLDDAFVNDERTFSIKNQRKLVDGIQINREFMKKTKKDIFPFPREKSKEKFLGICDYADNLHSKILRIMESIGSDDEE